MTHHTAMLGTLIWGTAVVFAGSLYAQRAPASTPRATNDTQQGRYNEMTERYNLWQAEQSKFDVIFAKQLRDANENKSRDLCTQQQHSEKVTTLRGLLDDQISAQKG